jgi:hypothetical protein
MNPISKPLTEIVAEGWKMVTTLPKGMKVYGKQKERIFYDCVNEQILWRYESEFKEEDTR